MLLLNGFQYSMFLIKGHYLLLLITNLFADANTVIYHHCAIWALLMLFMYLQCSAVDAQILYLFSG